MSLDTGISKDLIAQMVEGHIDDDNLGRLQRLPRKDAIEMVRVDANPFSAEFPQRSRKRVEITTKPGSDGLHGGAKVLMRSAALNVYVNAKGLDFRLRLVAWKRRHLVLQPCKLVGDVGRQQIAARGQHLSELDKNGAERLEREAQAFLVRPDGALGAAELGDIGPEAGEFPGPALLVAAHPEVGLHPDVPAVQAPGAEAKVHELAVGGQPPQHLARAGVDLDGRVAVAAGPTAVDDDDGQLPAPRAFEQTDAGVHDQ